MAANIGDRGLQKRLDDAVMRPHIDIQPMKSTKRNSCHWRCSRVLRGLRQWDEQQVYANPHGERSSNSQHIQNVSNASIR